MSELNAAVSIPAGTGSRIRSVIDPAGRLGAAPQYYHLHIVGCGGTSLLGAMQHLFPAGLHGMTTRDDAAAFMAMPEAARHGFRYVHSHQPNNLRPYLKPGHAIITMLRDPVAKAISTYFWMWRHRQQGYGWVLPDIERGMPLREWCQTGGGVANIRHTAAGCWLATFLRDNPPGVSHALDYTADELIALIEQRQVFVGFTEYFDETLLALSAAMGFDHAPTWALQAASGGPRLDDLHPDIIDRVSALLAEDLKLYQVLKRRFEGLNIRGLLGSGDVLPKLRVA